MMRLLMPLTLALPWACSASEEASNEALAEREEAVLSTGAETEVAQTAAGQSPQEEEDDPRARMRPAEWGTSAPGEQVVPSKLLPIESAPYSPPDALRHAVSDEDLVIGFAAGDQARAYPIKMLGGPTREIINDRLAGEPYAVNW